MRSGLARQALAEFIGTSFLLMAVVGSGIAASRLSPGDAGLQLLQAAVDTGAAGGYIAAAYFFTSSTSFANPAVTVARTLSDTLAGISPAHAAFVAAQLLATTAAVAAVRLLYPTVEKVAEEVIVPHPVEEVNA